ncbi:MAG: hypothetical protein HC862_17750 [Scytonema sp. RU_4_4]|nr:hypothetical protein [Scytonema sp. RU_4_4]NJR75772.1 hypothetical protein [Scytonema sp. CRU_2_7]
MADIKITELRPAGSELFQDSESFLNELNDQEMSVFGGDGKGGGGSAISISASVQTALTLFSQASASAGAVSG